MAGLVAGDVVARLVAIEDKLAILDLIARYGPAVDSASADQVARLWHPEGVYEFDSTTLIGQAVGSVVEVDTHRAYLEAGCAHVLSPAVVEITGDTAHATNYSCVFVHRGDHWVAERVSANRWSFTRSSTGWRVSHRTNALLDGHADARDLLRRTPELD